MIDPLAARGSSQPCPTCAAVSTMTLRPKLVARPLGTHSLAGAQMKVSAREAIEIFCDAEVGGCGTWKAVGYVTADGKLTIPRNDS